MLQGTEKRSRMKKKKKKKDHDRFKMTLLVLQFLAHLNHFSEGQITLWNLKTLSVPWFHVFFVAVEIKRKWFLEHTSPLKRGDE